MQYGGVLHGATSVRLGPTGVRPNVPLLLDEREIFFLLHFLGVSQHSSYIEHALCVVLLQFHLCTSLTYLDSFRTMAEPYSGLEVASAEHTQQSPELVDHSADAPERTLVPNSPELEKKWPLPVSLSNPVRPSINSSADNDPEPQS